MEGLVFLVLSLVAGVVVLAIIGLVAVIKWLANRGRARPLPLPLPLPPPSVAWQLLTRTQKLLIVEEVLGEGMPPHLAAELRGLQPWRYPPEQQTTVAAHVPAPAPSPVPLAPLPTPPSVPPAPAPGALPAPPPGEPPALSEAAFDLAPFAAPDLAMAAPAVIDDAPLAAPDEVVAAAASSPSKLKLLFSFENVIFLLAACLILGGTLYLVATTWDRVSTGWQELYAEALVVFYGWVLLATAHLLRRRLGLPVAAAVLAAIATAMAVAAAVLAAATFGQDSPTVGLLGAVLAQILAVPAMGLLVRLHGRPRRVTVLFALALVALAGGSAALMHQHLLAGAWLLALGVFFCPGLLLRAVPSGRTTFLLSTLTLPAGALLLPTTLGQPAVIVAPALIALAFACRPARRLLPAPLVVLSLLALIAVAAGLGHASLPLLTALAALAIVATVDATATTPGPFLLGLAALLTGFLALTWTAGFGFAVWPVDLATLTLSPEQLARLPLAALGALPWTLALFTLALAWGTSRARPVVEGLGYLLLAATLALAAAPYPRPSLVAAIAAVAAVALAYGNARAAQGAARLLAAHWLGLFAAFLVGSMAGVTVALAAVGGCALLLLATRARAGFATAIGVLPLVVVTALAAHTTRFLPVALSALFGLLLLRPRPAVAKVAGPLVLPALVCALLLGLFWAGDGEMPLLASRHLSLALLLALLPALVWTSSGRAPWFVTVEVLLGLAGAGLGGAAGLVLLATIPLLVGRHPRALSLAAASLLPLAGLSLYQNAPRPVVLAGLTLASGLCLFWPLATPTRWPRWLAMPGLLAALAIATARLAPAAMTLSWLALGSAPFFAWAVLRRNPWFIVLEAVLAVALLALLGLALALGSEPSAPAAIPAGIAGLALLIPIVPATAAARWSSLPLVLAAVAVLYFKSFAGAAPAFVFPVVAVVALAPFFLTVMLRGRPGFLVKELSAFALLLAFAATVTALLADTGSRAACVAGSAGLVGLWMFLGCARKLGPRAARVAWALVPLGSPLPLLSFTDALLHWPAALAAMAGVAILCLQSRRHRDAGTAALGLSAGLLALLWVAATATRPIAHGGDPVRHLPLLAMAIAGYGMLMASVGGRISYAAPRFLRRLEATTVVLGEVVLLLGIGLWPVPDAGQAALVVLAIAVLACAAVLLAFRSGQGWPFYLAESALGLAYGYLRVRTGWLDGMRDLDGLATCGLAFVNLAIARTLRTWRAGLGARESEIMGMLLPLLAPIFLAMDSPLRTVGVFAAAATYALLARQRQRPALGWLAGLLANVGLVPLWLHYDVHSPIAFALPVGTTLAILGRVNHARLGRHGPVVRSLASLCVFGATSFQVFAFSSPWPALILAVCAILAVLLGILWRVRAYLYVGFACLLLDILANLTRWSMADRLRASLVGLGAGMALLALGVLVAKHKQRLLERYRRLQAWSW